MVEEAEVTPEAMAESTRSRADEGAAKGSGQVGSGQKADLSWLIIMGN